MRKKLIPIIFAILITVIALVAMWWGTFKQYTQNDQQRDIILVLDNSGSMKENDPFFLALGAAKKFLLDNNGKHRIGIVIFGQTARVIKPLDKKEDAITRDLSEIVKYKEKFTNIPAAIIKAIDELKDNGREDAQKRIILLTDGIVDIENKRQHLEMEKRLKKDLLQECKNKGIHITCILFSDQEDSRLIQMLAFKTDGEYFKAYKKENINIDELITQKNQLQAFVLTRIIISISLVFWLVIFIWKQVKGDDVNTEEQILAKNNSSPDQWIIDMNRQYQNVISILISLSIASLILPIFFIRDLLRIPEHESLMPYFNKHTFLGYGFVYWSWDFLALSFLCGVLYCYVSAARIKEAYRTRTPDKELFWCRLRGDKTLQRWLSVSFASCVVFFICGLIFFLYFVGETVAVSSALYP